jgi:hypothetical protein
LKEKDLKLEENLMGLEINRWRQKLPDILLAYIPKGADLFPKE